MRWQQINRERIVLLLMFSNTSIKSDHQVMRCEAYQKIDWICYKAKKIPQTEAHRGLKDISLYNLWNPSLHPLIPHWIYDVEPFALFRKAETIGGMTNGRSWRVAIRDGMGRDRSKHDIGHSNFVHMCHTAGADDAVPLQVGKCEPLQNCEGQEWNTRRDQKSSSLTSLSFSLLSLSVKLGMWRWLLK